MGVLYARVGGTWQPVIASPPPPADEVWVWTGAADGERDRAVGRLRPGPGPDAVRPDQRQLDIWCRHHRRMRLRYSLTPPTGSGGTVVRHRRSRLPRLTICAGCRAWGRVASDEYRIGGGMVARPRSDTFVTITNTMTGVKLLTGRRYRFRVVDQGCHPHASDVRLQDGASASGMPQRTMHSVPTQLAIDSHRLRRQWKLSGLFDRRLGSLVTSTSRRRTSPTWCMLVAPISALQFYIEDIGPVVGRVLRPSSPADRPLEHGVGRAGIEHDDGRGISCQHQDPDRHDRFVHLPHWSALPADRAYSRANRGVAARIQYEFKRSGTKICEQFWSSTGDWNGSLAQAYFTGDGVAGPVTVTVDPSAAVGIARGREPTSSSRTSARSAVRSPSLIRLRRGRHGHRP